VDGADGVAADDERVHAALARWAGRVGALDPFAGGNGGASSSSQIEQPHPVAAYAEEVYLL
jgi:hypothetical protein